jgi:hypothetical protein
MDKAWIDLIELGLKIIAVFGAGIWAFSVLRLLCKGGGADSLARHSEARIRELELRAKQQAAVSVDIRPTITRSLDGDGYLITAVVELANRSSLNTKINWKNEPLAFHVRLAKFDADGKPKYDPPTRFRVPLTFNPKSGAISHIIRAGTTESIPFAFKVVVSRHRRRRGTRRGGKARSAIARGLDRQQICFGGGRLTFRAARKRPEAGPDHALAMFDDRLAMGTKVPNVPYQASVNFVVIGNVLSAKAEGVVVTGMLSEGGSIPQQREQKCGGCAFQNNLHFAKFPQNRGQPLMSARRNSLADREVVKPAPPQSSPSRPGSPSAYWARRSS